MSLWGSSSLCIRVRQMHRIGVQKRIYQQKSAHYRVTVHFSRTVQSQMRESNGNKQFRKQKSKQVTSRVPKGPSKCTSFTCLFYLTKIPNHFLFSNKQACLSGMASGVHIAILFFFRFGRRLQHLESNTQRLPLNCLCDSIMCLQPNKFPERSF